ncbi:SMAD/FHA domain-containing protein [Suillus americanus]|nr:SMAD/FHA domain-containing protein [Suillus americanus]
MTILGSFLRGRRRETSRSPEPAPRERTHSPSDRSQYSTPAEGTFQSSPSISVNAGPTAFSNPLTHHICLVPHIDSNHTFHFEPISRDLRDGDTPVRIGRFTNSLAVNARCTDKIAFNTKVLSRFHAEIWSDNGKLYIKDTKSSSGTFLNHVRLSPAGSESAPHQIKEGDIVQLGLDYQGGSEDIWKSVKIRVEIGRDLQEERIKDDEETQEHRLFTLNETQPHSHVTNNLNELSSDHGGTNTHSREIRQGPGNYSPFGVGYLASMHILNVSMLDADSGSYKYCGSRRTDGSRLAFR